jgi:cell division protein FtsI (penicillin-binding protein 3)
MKHKKSYAVRFYFLIIVLFLGFCGLVLRLVDLSIIDRDFLQQQSDARTIRIINIPANRGMIMDRNGMPLAISTPVDSVWVNPQMFNPASWQLTKLSKLLDIPIKELQKKINKKKNAWFIYLKRHIQPQIADEIRAMKIDGLYLQREYMRYYPEGEVTAHVLGITNVDDQGQEGLELAFDSWLRGTPGKMEVVKDRLGHIVDIIKTESLPKEGHNLILSIDRRIQYQAYYELKKTVQKYRAESGSVVVLDVKTGEILAMVNQPSYNPNNRATATKDSYRNRAVTDSFEPGSTIKTFSIASALDSGKYFAATKIDTNPGRFVVDGNIIIDEGVNHGVLTVTQVLQKSSNIGISKIILSLPPQNLWNLLHKFGFSERTSSGFPGEASGSIVDLHDLTLRPFDLATLSFGYAITVTPLQLASAYAAIANDGVKLPVTFVKSQGGTVTGEQVMQPKIAHEMLNMLQSILASGGTGTRANVAGFTVAGKTGTARIANKTYDKNRHVSNFVGIAPASNPRLVVAVVIRDPKGQDFGGLVAAPAFATIMEGALRFMGVPPDDVE